MPAIQELRRTGQVDELAVAERGQVGHDLPTPLDVVEHHAGEAGQLAAHEDDGALGSDLPQVLVGQPARGQHEPVDGAGASRWICSHSTRGDSSALTSSSVYSETRARISAPRISSK